MKGSRIAAIGLVAAAAACGSPPGICCRTRAAKAAPPCVRARPRRRSCSASRWSRPRAPHSRKLVLSGRTEADKKVMATARSGGVITELKVRRGARVKKGDVIAVLSDEAREAQVAQARALLTQRRTELDAKRRLIEIGHLPRLELVNLEAQFKAAEAGLAAAEAERDRGIVRAPWSRHRDRRAGRGRQAPHFRSPAGKSPRSSRSIRCWRWSRCRNASSAASSSATRPRSAGHRRDRDAAASATSPRSASPDHAHLPRRGRDRQSGRRDPGRHHRRGRDSARSRRRRRACRARR